MKMFNMSYLIILFLFDVQNTKRIRFFQNSYEQYQISKIKTKCKTTTYKRIPPITLKLRRLVMYREYLLQKTQFIYLTKQTEPSKNPQHPQKIKINKVQSSHETQQHQSNNLYHQINFNHGNLDFLTLYIIITYTYSFSQLMFSFNTLFTQPTFFYYTYPPNSIQNLLQTLDYNPSPFSNKTQPFQSCQTVKTSPPQNTQKPVILRKKQIQKKCQEKNKGRNASFSIFIPQNEQNEIRQVKSRNILPNVINLLLSFIRRVNKSGKIVKKIIQKIGEGKYDLKKFYSYQIYLKQAITNFTSRNILHQIITFCQPASNIFNLQQQMFYNKVSRLLIHYFLKQQAPLSILTSKKEHKTKRIDHLKIYRFVFNDLKRYYRKERQNQ